jgi:hypothetical protein
MPHPGDDYPDFTENAQGGFIKGFLLTRRANQYKRHIDGSWYPVTFKCHYGLAGFWFAGVRVRPEMTRFIVFSDRINNTTSRGRRILPNRVRHNNTHIRSMG